MGLILLVRHGQASWGAANYDDLSERGRQQSAVLGSWLGAAGVRPTRTLAGSMRRHRQTAQAAAEAAGWSLDLEVDAGWDEFDHIKLLEAHDAPTQWAHDTVSRRDFDDLFDAAVGRWVSAEHDTDYPETFTAFGDRVRAALRRTVAAIGPGETAVVFTSGGPISCVTSDLVRGGSAAWSRLNPVAVNTAITKVALGSRGTTLVSFNEHGHLPAELVTYR